MEREEDVRTSCCSRLALLEAQYGDELPYAGVLSEGFPFRGRRVPFLSFHGRRLHLPARRAHYPDGERLAARFERFE